MLRNLNLKQTSLLLSVLLAVGGVALILTSLYIGKRANTIQTLWVEFQTVRSEKVRLESSLRATLGYGGMIHNFKNYILRKKHSHLEKTFELLGGANVILRQYSSLGVSNAENNAIEDIKRVIGEYREV